MRTIYYRLQITNCRFVLLLLICNLQFAICNSFAQSAKIDSLLSLIKKDKDDTNKVNHLHRLNMEYQNIGDYQTALPIEYQTLSLAQKMKWKKGEAKAFNSIGNIYGEQGDYPKTLDYYLKALKIFEDLGDENKISSVLGNIGIVYWTQEDYPKALDYYFKALKIDEKLGSKNDIAGNLGNIGIVYQAKGDYTKALTYCFKALEIKEELKDEGGIAIWLGNIGSIYYEQARHANGIGDSLYQKALGCYFRSLKIAEEIGDKNEITADLNGIGSSYIDIKKYMEAEKYLIDALRIDKEIGVMQYEMDVENAFTKLYENTNHYQLALEHYKKAVALKDTLFNADKNKEITQKEMNYEFEKKEAAQKAGQDKQAAVADADKKKQQIILMFVVCGLLLVLVFAGFIYRALRITQKQKALIEKQKRFVEEKQKEILDSIHYARRIQNAILPTEKYIDKTLKRLMKNKLAD